MVLRLPISNRTEYIMAAVDGEYSKPPQKATIYVLSVTALGAATLVEGLYHWTCPDVRRFLAYLLVAMIGAALKVRLPRMPGTFSLSFLVVLMSIVELTYPEALVIGAVSTLVQCLWKAHPRPTAAQLLFNTANFTTSIAVCCVVVQSVASRALQNNLAAELVLVTCIFFVLNTLFVSGIISIIEGQDILAIWQRWFVWSFPYYLIGATVASLAVISGRVYGWGSSLMLLLVMVMVYGYYRIWMRHQSAVTEP